jgi:hypothetical protein
MDAIVIKARSPLSSTIAHPFSSFSPVRSTLFRPFGTTDLQP